MALKPYSWARYTTVAKSPCCVVLPAHRPPRKVVPSSKPFQVKACGASLVNHPHRQSYALLGT